MKIVFFKRPKAKQFDYKPRYYDQAKEEREQRRKELGLADDEAGKRAMFKGELQRRWRGDASYQKEKENQRKKVIIYLIIIGFTTYYIFFTDFIQKFVSLITSI